MDYQQIQNKLFEIFELQNIIDSKINSQTIQDIITRDKLYSDKPKDKILELNNGVLENKINVTPLEIILIQKINELNLDGSMTNIYNNLPEKEEEWENYLEVLYNKYILVDNTLKIIFKIEDISKTEVALEFTEDKSEYVKLENKINEFIEPVFLEYTSIPSKIIIDKIMRYLEEKSKESKTQLLIEKLSLSYERNQFDYINDIKYINKITKNDDNIILKLNKQCTYFSIKDKINKIILAKLAQKNLDQLYSELKGILNLEKDYQKRV